MDPRNLNKSGYGPNELIKSGSGSQDNFKSKHAIEEALKLLINIFVLRYNLILDRVKNLCNYKWSFKIDVLCQPKNCKSQVPDPISNFRSGSVGFATFWLPASGKPGRKNTNLIC